MFRFVGKTLFFGGGSRGIGKAIPVPAASPRKDRSPP
jgi:hypothetical protein